MIGVRGLLFECLCHASPPQHHDDGGAPEVPAEEMSSGV